MLEANIILKYLKKDQKMYTDTLQYKQQQLLKEKNKHNRIILEHKILRYDAQLKYIENMINVIKEG